MRSFVAVVAVFSSFVTSPRLESRRSPTRHGSFSPHQNLMKLSNLIILSLCLTGFLGLSAISAAEEEASWIEQTSPKGNYQIQKVENQDSRFTVSTKNPAERAPLPGSTGETDPSECQVGFYFSPDENWFFYSEEWRRRDLRARELYQHETGVKFAPLKTRRSFAKALQDYVVKNGVFKRSDFVDSHEKGYDHLGTNFRGWSFDSSRLLIGMHPGVGERGPFYVYYNTHTKTLEQTPYLRQVNKAVAKLARDYATDIVCAEPMAPLPSESELKARMDALDEKLTKALAERTGEMSNDEANDLREAQDKWLKMRDEGVKTYLAFAPKGEEERRHLQFLGDVTATRIEEINQSSIAALTR